MSDTIFDKLQIFYTIEEQEAFFGEIEAIAKLFADLNRAIIPSTELIELKYAMMHWRKYCKSRLLHFASPANEEQILISFGHLGINLEKGEWKKLIQLCPSSKDKISSYAGLPGYGPQKRMSMVANRQIRFSPNRWLRDPDFSDYRYDGNEVIYRGVRFQEGDILLSAVNLGGNGSFTAITDPRNYTFHSGFFVLYPDQGRLVPSVLEAYELGVRPVPLSHFLSSKFSCYVEVFRHKDYPLGTPLGAHAHEMCQITNGYNFDTEDPDRSYLACTTVGNELFRRIGIEEIPAKSIMTDPTVLKNGMTFGLARNLFLFPVDFLIDPLVKFVGVVDNGMFLKAVTQEVSDRIFRQAFASGEVNFKRFPLYFHLIYYFMGHLRRGTLPGRILGLIRGFTRKSLPKGNDLAVTMIDTCALYVAWWEQKLQRFFTSRIEPNKYFSIDSFFHHYAGHKRVKKIYSTLQSWFS